MRSRRRRLWTGLTLALTIVAALLWARLKLVTGLPRTAYADPAEAGASSSDK